MMSLDKGVAIDALFIGCTRPTIVFGVTYEAFALCFFIAGLAFLGTGNLLFLALYFPLHAICFAICKKDSKSFRLLILALETKYSANSRLYWKSSTASPFFNTRASIKK